MTPRSARRDDLRSGGLINSEDFAAKKALILAQHLRVYDFKEEMEVAKKLKRRRDGSPPPNMKFSRRKLLGTGK